MNKQPLTVVYVAGAYRASTPWLVEQNVRKAEEAGLKLWQAGFVPIVPHTQTRFYQGSALDSQFLEGTLEMLRRCDVVYVLPEFEMSEGTKGEIAEARRLGKQVYYTLNFLQHGVKST